MLLISFLRDQSHRRLPHVIDPLSQSRFMVLSILLIKFLDSLCEEVFDTLAEDPLWNVAFLGQPNSCLHSI